MSDARAAPERRLARLAARPLIFGGNRVQLLVGGDDYFPLLLAAINSAEQSVHVETYIFEDDNIGQRVADALAAASDRGVAVRLMVDGFGAGAFAGELIGRLTPLGAEVVVYRPTRWWRPERRLLRRLHRKVAIVDDRIAFVGGINIIDDHHFPAGVTGLGPRFDYAVACEGPVVAAVADNAKRLWRTVQWRQLRGARESLRLAPTPVAPPFRDGVRASYIVRDNLRNRRSIEHAYLDAFSQARDDVVIANAYFLPGRRFRDALMELAKRGVRVRLLLQGHVEYRLQHYAQQSLYAELLAAGVEIHEYRASYLHAKAAVVDDQWATVGSSNIDPLSLLLAREANIAVFDRAFTIGLRQSLEDAINTRSQRIDVATFSGRSWLLRAIARVAYAAVRLLTAVAVRPGAA